MSATIESTIPENIKSFLSAPKKLLIGGQWVEAKSGKTFDVFDPATDQVVAQAAEGDAADVEQAVAAARKAFDSGPWSTCLLYTSPSPRDQRGSRMPSSA